MVAERLPPSVVAVVVAVLGGEVGRAPVVVTVTAGQEAQLLQGLLVLGQLGPLGEEAGGQAADVEVPHGAVELGQPGAQGQAGLEAREDGSGGDGRRDGCKYREEREGERVSRDRPETQREQRQRETRDTERENRDRERLGTERENRDRERPGTERERTETERETRDGERDQRQ